VPKITKPADRRNQSMRRKIAGMPPYVKRERNHAKKFTRLYARNLGRNNCRVFFHAHQSVKSDERQVKRSVHIHILYDAHTYL